MVGHGSEFTILAFYINMLTMSWMCILSKGDRRAGRVTVKWTQQSLKSKSKTAYVDMNPFSSQRFLRTGFLHCWILYQDYRVTILIIDCVGNNHNVLLTRIYHVLSFSCYFSFIHCQILQTLPYYYCYYFVEQKCLKALKPGLHSSQTEAMDTH